MKTLLLLLSIFLTSEAFSQLNNVFQPKSWDYREQRATKPKVTYSKPWRKVLTNDTAKVQDDRSVLKLKVTPEYRGNNGKGADIYAIQPYNMPCLVPDSTFNSRMPVKGSAMISKADW